MKTTKLFCLFFIIGCGSNLSFGPKDWVDAHQQNINVSATQYGDCTTDAQCELLVPHQNFFCYKEKSYVGLCAKVLQ